MKELSSLSTSLRTTSGYLTTVWQLTKRPVATLLAAAAVLVVATAALLMGNVDWIAPVSAAVGSAGATVAARTARLGCRHRPWWRVRRPSALVALANAGRRSAPRDRADDAVDDEPKRIWNCRNLVSLFGPKIRSAPDGTEPWSSGLLPEPDVSTRIRVDRISRISRPTTAVGCCDHPTPDPDIRLANLGSTSSIGPGGHTRGLFSLPAAAPAGGFWTRVTSVTAANLIGAVRPGPTVLGEVCPAQRMV